MLDFQIFRFRVIINDQRTLFEKELSRSQILRNAIESHPQAEIRQGLIWHIGNIQMIDDLSMYFRVGRTSKSTLEVYDETKGSFADQEFETAPYTHVIVDLELELCAIAHKQRLSRYTVGIANALVKLLNTKVEESELSARIEIEPINDPHDFVTHIQSAYSVSKFVLFSKLPNPFDADEMFEKPLQKMVEKAEGEKGKAEIAGENLNKNVLEAVSKSAAAIGDDAAAWIVSSEGSKPTKKELRGNHVNFTYDDIDGMSELSKLIKLIREIYAKVRGTWSDKDDGR